MWPREELSEALGVLGVWGGAGWAYLEGALVGKHVDACGSSARLAEKQQLLKEENATQGFVAPTAYCELILPDQLALFLEVDLPSGGLVGAWPLPPPPFTPTAPGHHGLPRLTSQPWMASMASKSLPCRSWKCTRLWAARRALSSCAGPPQARASSCSSSAYLLMRWMGFSR